MKPKSILTAILFVLTPVLGLAQSVISVNIAGGNANSPSAGGGGGQGIVTGAAGLGQLGNWNNAIGSSNVGAGLTVPALVDSTGAATAASFSWVTNNTWSTSTADGQGGDVDMMSGYIDNFHANGSINVAGLGPEFTGPGYTVLVYYNTDNSGMTAGFTVADNAGNTDTRYGHQLVANANFPLAGGTDGYIISTETANNTLFSANIVQLSGFSGSEFTMTGNAGTVGSARARPNTIQIVAIGPPVDVEITEFHRTGTGDIQISWKSRQDRQYDILSNSDLSTPRLQWAEVAGAQDIQGDASGITTAVVATPFPETGYLVVREEGLPALFEDDLETDTGWTAIVNDANGNTDWERGSPNGSTGPLTGADGSANAWCTNLGDYGTDSNISLRSPAIDLTGVSEAELSFAAFRDADGFGDTAVVRFLRAADQVQLGADTHLDMSVLNTDYATITIPVVAEALAETILVEWNFVSDSSADAFSGLSIDNIGVSITE